MTPATCCGEPTAYCCYAGRPLCHRADCPENGADAVRDQEAGEKGWSTGYRLPRNRQEQIVAEWDAATYELENPL